MAILDFDYSRALRQAGNVDSIAREMESLADNKLNTVVENLNSSWDGDASEQFITYCENIVNDIRSEVRKLKGYAERIRDVADIIEEAEQRAKEAIRRAAEAKEREERKGEMGVF